MSVKNKLTVGFITTLSGRWPRELPESRMKEYGEWLVANLPEVDVICPAELGASPESVAAITEDFRSKRVDLVVSLYGAFTGDDVCTYIAQELGVPIVLWAPKEPPFEKEDRLYANALVALTMNSASLKRLGHTCHAIYGSKEEAVTAKKVVSLIEAYRTIKTLRKTFLGLFGYRPTAFYNCAFDEGLIRKTFGVRIEETELKVVFDQMAILDDATVAADMKAVEEAYSVDLPEGHLENHSRLFLALKEVFATQGYDYGTIKCWPEMGNLHTTPCAVLGRLADAGVHIGCEGDVDAELAQIVQNILTGQPTFITDMINIDEEENTLTYWHCGNAAPSLQNKKYDVSLKNHPLAGQGSAFYCALKTGPVTVARFCNIDGVYKLFLLRGEAVDCDRYTRGNMVNVKLKTPVLEVVEKTIEYAVPHHYSVVWDDVADEMIKISELLGIEVIEL